MPFNYVIRHWTTATTMIGSSKDDALVVRVDDHAAVREAILEALETKGFPVQMASSWGGLSADSFDRSRDFPSDKQMDATLVLCQTLKMFFPIRDMGGHREYTGHANDGRACPGEYGLVLAASIRRKLELGLP